MSRKLANSSILSIVLPQCSYFVNWSLFTSVLNVFTYAAMKFVCRPTASVSRLRGEAKQIGCTHGWAATCVTGRISQGSSEDRLQSAGPEHDLGRPDYAGAAVRCAATHRRDR